MKYIFKSEKETFAFAKKYAAKLKGGEIIGLVGDLGAGKTVFTKGLAAGLGIKKTITSPTFVLMKVYPLKDNDIKQLVHIDAYRLKGSAGFETIGANDYFGDKNTVTVIEWADMIKKILPPKTKIIKIFIDKEKRIFQI